MKDVLSKIEEILKNKKQEKEIQTKIYNDKSKFLNKQCNDLYLSLKKNLFELDGKKILDYNILITEDIKTKILSLFFNNNVWATFEIKINHSKCSCEGPCDCVITSNPYVNCVIYKNKKQYNEYFSYPHEQRFENKDFPSAIVELIEKI